VRRGFSLLELLVVIAILGVLLALVPPSYLRWRAQAQVEEAARSLAWTLQQARAEAKRTNTAQTVSITANGWTYRGSTVTLQNIQISSNYTGFPPLSVTFNPPYGTTDAPLKKLTLTHQRFSDLQRSVHVVGVIGKVIVR
jgi:prepilin-type N-terminal cleavage/methylation domain-containing protein